MCKLVCPVCKKIETVPTKMIYADGMCNECLEGDEFWCDSCEDVKVEADGDKCYACVEADHTIEAEHKAERAGFTW